MRSHGVLVVLLGVLLVAGCSAPNVYDVQSSGSLFVGAQKGDRVFVQVTNASSLQSATGPLDNLVRQQVQMKGYKLVDSPDSADVVLLVNIRYSGLTKKAVDMGNVLLGAGVGAAAGGVAGALSHGGHHGHHYGRNVVGGALFGAAAGAGVAYGIEKYNEKNTFSTVVDVQATSKKQGKTSAMTVQVTIGEKELTMESAASRAVPDVAGVVGGQF